MKICIENVELGKKQKSVTDVWVLLEPPTTPTHSNQRGVAPPPPDTRHSSSPGRAGDTG